MNMKPLILLTALTGCAIAPPIEHDARPLSTTEREWACSLIGSVVYDARLSTEWMSPAAKFLRDSCSDSETADVTIDRMCQFAREDGDDLPKECPK